ncbi:hypothetical protein FB451DRAFT_1369831 [Mycena latifolia]|nr:hypothetical protein FB451DRAFT_1369831 [Mycena latifolia]
MYSRLLPLEVRLRDPAHLLTRAAASCASATCSSDSNAKMRLLRAVEVEAKDAERALPYPYGPLLLAPARARRAPTPRAPRGFSLPRECVFEIERPRLAPRRRREKEKSAGHPVPDSADVSSAWCCSFKAMVKDARMQNVPETEPPPRAGSIAPPWAGESYLSRSKRVLGENLARRRHQVGLVWPAAATFGDRIAFSGIQRRKVKVEQAMKRMALSVACANAEGAAMAASARCPYFIVRVSTSNPFIRGVCGNTARYCRAPAARPVQIAHSRIDGGESAEHPFYSCKARAVPNYSIGHSVCTSSWAGIGAEDVPKAGDMISRSTTSPDPDLHQTSEMIGACPEAGLAIFPKIQTCSGFSDSRRSGRGHVDVAWPSVYKPALPNRDLFLNHQIHNNAKNRGSQSSGFRAVLAFRINLGYERTDSKICAEPPPEPPLEAVLKISHD